MATNDFANQTLPHESAENQTTRASAAQGETTSTDGSAAGSAAGQTKRVNKDETSVGVAGPSNQSALGSRAETADPAGSVSLVTQSDAGGRPVSGPPAAQRGRRRKLHKMLRQGSQVEINELHPAFTAPRAKPADLLLILSDLTDLAVTGVRSVVSGFSIMVKDKGNLQRRALHEDSRPLLNGSSTSSLDRNKSTTKMQDKSERASLVLWWRPLYTMWYFLMECKCLTVTYTVKLWHNKAKVFCVLLLLGILAALYHVEGSHQQYVDSIEKQVLWCAYWVILGVMSSIGLGTGLHTFVLYLGPFIAQVTLAAYECQSLDFPEPPYPQSIECPDEADVAGKASSAITLWSIMGKVRLEAMMWGAGTALGELPPYFMARAARLSGTEEEIDDEDFEEVVKIEKTEREHPEQVKQMGLLERTKVYMHDLVHQVGFFGILACASIPNPLFDLAGITCGHFLVPFWTFFGATLIGKAIIKMHIQQLFVIFVFSQHHIESLINLLKSVPKVGARLGEPFREYLLNQRAKLHKQSGQASTETPWLGWVFEKIIMLMVIYFILSIVNSFAQNYHKRLCKARRNHVESGKLQ